MKRNPRQIAQEEKMELESKNNNIYRRIWYIGCNEKNHKIQKTVLQLGICIVYNSKKSKRRNMLSMLYIMGTPKKWGSKR
jgi:hypothetical protein